MCSFFAGRACLRWMNAELERTMAPTFAEPVRSAADAAARSRDRRMAGEVTCFRLWDDRYSPLMPLARISLV
jgi:hypothetical protein